MHAIEIFWRGQRGDLNSERSPSIFDCGTCPAAIHPIPPLRSISTATAPFHTSFPQHISFPHNLWFVYCIATIASESPPPLSWNVMASNTGHGSSPSTVDRPGTGEGDATIISNALTSVAVSYFLPSSHSWLGFRILAWPIIV